MRTCFERRRGDAAGRLGKLTHPRYSEPIQTPTLLPVINPNIETLTASEIEAEFAPEAFITNSYVIYRTDALRERALTDGVHEVLDVSCPIMTDSGSFQLSEYGEIEVDNAEIIEFQAAIGSDIITPIDIPTGPAVDHDRAKDEMTTTVERVFEASTLLGEDVIHTGPIQGGNYPTLRRQAAQRVKPSDAGLFPVGAAVPLMEDYRFDDLVDVVMAAKRGLGPAAPVHLFGAGHPMMFSLAVAMGCDLFDSAAYALYAREGRYLTPGGTIRLDRVEEFPCVCPVCSEYTVDGLHGLSAPTQERELARHNLYVSFGELKRVREALRRGRLFELLERRARAHPAMLSGYRRLLTYNSALARADRAVKETFMYLSTESAHRPEVAEYHRRLRAWELPAQVTLIDAAIETTPAEKCWRVKPPFGPIPPGLAHTYPVTAEVPTMPDETARKRAIDGIHALLTGTESPTVEFVHDRWPDRLLERLPAGVTATDRDEQSVY